MPEVRFNGFSEEWQVCKLFEVAEFNPRSSLPEQFRYVDLGSVVGTNLISYRTELKKTAPSRAQRLAKRGDVFYQMVRPYQKNNFLFDLPYADFVFSTGYAQLRPYGNSYFLLSRLQESRFVSNVLDRSTGTSYPAINSNDLAQIEITVPKKEVEQTQIGNFFKQLDETITIQQQELDTLKQTKQGFLQKMFPKEGESLPEIRFPGFSGEWEKSKLNDIGIVEMCKRIFKNQTTVVGDIPFYKIGTFGRKADSFISRELFEEYKSKYPFPEVGDILISASGTIGRTVVYNGEDAYYQDSNIVWLKPNKDRVKNCFLQQFYQIVKWHGTEGSTIKRLYNSKIRETEIYLPSINEQELIGRFFNRLDNTIFIHEQELETLLETKKAFLQKMFV